jgi:ClpP class serine protease
VDQFYELFVSAVARGRNLPADKARALADGRVHLGKAAQDIGLVDGLMSFSGALARIRSDAAPSAPLQVPDFKPVRRASAAAADASVSTAADAKGDSMPDEKKNEAAPVTPPKVEAPVDPLKAEHERVAALRAAFAKDPAFALEMIEQGKSLLEAKAAYADKLEAENAQLREAAKEKQAPATAALPGVRRLAPKEDAPAAPAAHDGSAKEAFRVAVEELMAKGLSREVACQRVCAEHPELQEQMLRESNSDPSQAVSLDGQIRMLRGK